MKWWHSWVEIEKNRWNTIFSFLNFLNTYSWDFEIFEIKWWVADNAIPKELDVIISVENEKYFREELDLFLEKIKNTFDAPEIFYNLEILSTEGFNPLNKSIQKTNFKKLIKPIFNTQIWVLKMSKNIENLVQTSNNLWIFNIENNKLKITYSPRSSEIDDLEKIKSKIIYNFENFNIKIWEQYPWWEENPESEFIKEILEIYKKENNWKAKIVAYHAWLECWALVKKLWWTIKAISLWPTIKNAHTTSEMCELNSVEIIWKILTKYLEK
jgi:dipeptidase D